MKVLLFSPFSGIWPHSISEQKLEMLLRKSLKYETVTYRCVNNFISYCTTMESERVEVESSLQEREKICNRCNATREILDSVPQSNSKNFPKLTVHEKNQIEFAIKFLDYQDIESFNFWNIDVGRIALYETLIRYKKVNLHLDDLERKYFAIKLFQVMQTVIIASRVLGDELPDVVVCYSPQYSVTGGFAATCKLLGIKVIFVEGSGNVAERETNLRLWDWSEYGLMQPAMQHLEKFDSFELTRNRIKRAKRQLATIGKAQSHSVYSKKKQRVSTFDYFDFDKSKKLILLSMSSYDEVFSAYVIGAFPEEKYLGGVFKNQIDWIRATIDWASDNDIQLLIRPHPREFPNKRESMRSQHIEHWEEVIKDLPDCVKIDHPDFGLSIYDHFDEIDVLVTGWSFTGIEAMSRGIPVVTYDCKLPSYPDTIHLSGIGADDYFRNLVLALSLKEPKSIQDNAMRWLAFLSEHGTIRIFSRAMIILNTVLKFSPRNRYIAYLIRKTKPAIRYLLAWLPPSKVDLVRINSLFTGKEKDLFT
jgi:hypothetical protein